MNQFVIILLASLSNKDEYRCGRTMCLQLNYFNQGFSLNNRKSHMLLIRLRQFINVVKLNPTKKIDNILGWSWLEESHCNSFRLEHVKITN